MGWAWKQNVVANYLFHLAIVAGVAVLILTTEPVPVIPRPPEAGEIDAEITAVSEADRTITIVCPPRHFYSPVRVSVTFAPIGEIDYRAVVVPYTTRFFAHDGEIRLRVAFQWQEKGKMRQELRWVMLNRAGRTVIVQERP